MSLLKTFIPALLMLVAITISLNAQKTKEENLPEDKTNKELPSEPSSAKEIPKSSPISYPTKIAETVNNTQPKEEPKYPITFTQFLWNDVPFRGYSVLGDRLAQRDNKSYESMQHAWNVTTGLSFTTPIDGLSISMNVYSPTAHRQNKDNDYFFQSTPGNTTNYNTIVTNSINSGNANLLIDEAIKKNTDPSSIRLRKERNGLKDIFDTSILYKWNTRMGKVTTGFYFANNDNFNPITLGELVVGLEFPFWKVINPSYTAYYRFTSEGGGGGNGTSNHRLNISHTFFSENKINFTTSLAAGYHYHTNQSDFRSGVSDITPKIQVNFGSFFINFFDMIRPDSKVYDAGGFGVIKNSNRADGRVDDPSKVHGIQNQFVVEQIGRGVDNLLTGDTSGYGREALKAQLIQSYQQQKFVQHIYFFTIGYSLKF